MHYFPLWTKDKNVPNRIYFKKRARPSYVTKWEEWPGRPSLFVLFRKRMTIKILLTSTQHGTHGLPFWRYHNFYIHYAFNAVITWVNRWGNWSLTKIKYLLQVLMPFNSGHLSTGPHCNNDDLTWRRVPAGCRSPKKTNKISRGCRHFLSPQPWAQTSQDAQFYQELMTKHTTPLTAA